MFYLSYQISGALLWLIAVYHVLKRSNLNRVFGIDLAFLILASGLVGGRVFHVFYENPNYYMEAPVRVIKIWEGGFVFYGGLIAAFISSLTYCYIKKEDFFKWADFFAPLIAVGYIYGRIGCFLSGCCYGASCDLPWAVEQRHPTQLYAVFTESLLLVFLLSEKKRVLKRPKGVLFATWVVGHAIGRLFMEPYRDDFRGALVMGVSISQFISLILLFLGIFLLVWRLQIPQEK